MQINRTTIITGPAVVQFGGVTFWSKGDVLLKPVHKRFKIGTAHFGDVDERFSDRRYQVSFEPAGQFTNAIAAVLWPYGATPIGSSIFGASDDALVIWGRDNSKVTIHNAALTQMPGIRFGVSKTTIGSVQFTGLLANSTDPTNAAAYYTAATATYPGDAGFDVAEIFTQAPTATWGDAPWNAFLTESGWEISFALRLGEQLVDGLGTVDMTLQGIDVSAKAMPVGPTVAQALTALKTNLALGTSLATDDGLTIRSSVAGSPEFTMNAAALVDIGDIGYGSERKRLGMCEWIATRTITDGEADPLFEIVEFV